LPGVGYEHGDRQLRRRCIGKRSGVGKLAAANEALEAIGEFLVDRLNGFRIAKTRNKVPS